MLGHNKSLTLVAFSCFVFTKLLLVVVLSLPQLAWDKKSLFQFNVVYYQPSKGDHPKGSIILALILIQQVIVRASEN